MAHSYTPGLRVTGLTTVRKERRLPIAGSVLVRQGDRVKAGDVVARADLPGNAATVNVVNLLGIAVEDIPAYMIKKEGEAVRQDEVIAETRPFLKFMRSVAQSPIEGTIETISQVTGQVIVRAAPRPVDLLAYIDGTVVEVRPHEGVVVETRGAFIQGILGVGGEVCGELAVVGDGPESVVGPDQLDERHKGKIVVAGAFISSALFKRASDIGVEALIGGGLNDSDLRDLLGRDLGVAITGHEEIKPILIVTEGFGRIPMARATYDLLRARVGRRASASGATQIRAGVLRPEIIVPDAEATDTLAAPLPAEAQGLTIGSRIRIIREPYFGALGVVTNLPAGLEVLESETRVRVAGIRCDDGREVTVPRSNLEALES